MDYFEKEKMMYALSGAIPLIVFGVYYNYKRGIVDLTSSPKLKSYAQKTINNYNKHIDEVSGFERTKRDRVLREMASNLTFNYDRIKLEKSMKKWGKLNDLTIKTKKHKTRKNKTKKKKKYTGDILSAKELRRRYHKRH